MGEMRALPAEVVADAYRRADIEVLTRAGEFGVHVVAKLAEAGYDLAVIEAAGSERPPHGRGEIPEGHEVVAVEEGAEWRPAGNRSRRCCGHLARHQHCGKAPSVELNRRMTRKGKTFDRWFPYCPDHSYGRWVEDGKVMYWILRREDGSA